VLVIGAGASGLSAALAAADAGAETVLVDENARLGGSLTYTRRGDAAVRQQLQSLLTAVQRHPRIRCLTATTAAGYYADHWVALDTPEYLVKLRARGVVVAQGAFEQPAVFRNNDLAGTLLVTGAQRLMHRYSVAPATRIAILTANADGYRAAQEAIAFGMEVRAVLDLRPSPGPESVALTESLRASGVMVQWGAAVREAHAAKSGCIERLSWAPWADGAWLAATGGTGANAAAHDLSVDGLWISVGYAPANALLHQAQATFRHDAALAQYVPCELPDGLFACGKVNGRYSLESRLADGVRAGSAAAAHCGHGHASAAPRCPSGKWCRIRFRSWTTRRARTSSTSTRTCRSRISRTPRARALTAASCSSAIRPSVWVRARASIRMRTPSVSWHGFAASRRRRSARRRPGLSFTR
jgi:sarcosine oxidase subunit alpha